MTTKPEVSPAVPVVAWLAPRTNAVTSEPSIGLSWCDGPGTDEVPIEPLIRYRDHLDAMLALEQAAHKEMQRLRGEWVDLHQQIKALEKAVEFAKYMATGAEQLLTALRGHFEICKKLDDGDSVPTEDCDKAQELVSEYITAMAGDVYDFRKRLPAAKT